MGTLIPSQNRMNLKVVMLRPSQTVGLKKENAALRMETASLRNQFQHATANFDKEHASKNKPAASAAVDVSTKQSRQSQESTNNLSRTITSYHTKCKVLI
jgi:hypothetical protein